MEAAFEKQSFKKRFKSMLKVDFQRLFKMPLVYIMAGVALLLPILILVMTTLADAGGGAFTNVWQSVGAVSGTQMTMDLTGMCNLNMIYFLIAVFVCIFVSEDFRSGYAKNLFTVRSQKVDYVVSKSLVGFAGGGIMILAYFVGALIGGAIAGLSFDAGTSGAGGIAACLLSKIFLVPLFASIALTLSVVGKQKLWISVLGALAACMLLFTMIPMIAPLDANFVNVILCFAGSALFAAGFGAVSNLILNKTNLV